MVKITTNEDKIKELRPDVQWAGYAWIDECGAKGLKFKIIEAFRTQERQNSLYEQGRTKPGPVVSWTLKSYHTLRLAVDVMPINCTYEQLEVIAAKYGITHPIPIDKPHFQFERVGLPEPVINLSVDAKILALTRGIQRRTGAAKEMAERQLNRLLHRVGRE